MAKPTSRKAFSRANQLTSVLLVLPLLVFYEIGVLFADVMYGVDFVTQTLLRWVGLNGFLAIQIGICCVALAVALYLRRTQRFDIGRFVPVLLESGIYALTMGTFILFVMTELLGIDPALAARDGGVAKLGLFDKLVLSVGAGFYEELVFRLVLLGGLHLVGVRLFKLRTWVSFVIALVVSSVLFSVAHHLGPLGEPIRLGVFTYRMMAGLFFGALFHFRGFPVAVYTHAFYDIYVLMLR